MRTLLMSTLCACLTYGLLFPACQYQELHQAAAALERQEFDAAWLRVRSLLSSSPALFAEEAGVLCRQLRRQHAMALATSDQPDFHAAVRLLSSSSTPCRSADADDTQPTLATIARLHLRYGTSQAQEKHYDTALRAFQEIGTLPYSQPILEAARREEAWCRLSLATALAEAEWYEEAFAQLVRALHTGNAMSRQAVVRTVPTLVEQELAFWLTQRQYPRAFQVLRARQHSFQQEPEISLFFARTEVWLQQRIFDAVLSQSCATPVAEAAAPPPVAVTAVHYAQVGANSDTNVLLRNTTPYTLRLVLRGETTTAVTLQPQAMHRLRLASGAYVMGTVALGQCHSQPAVNVWTVEPGLLRAIELRVANE